MVAQSNKRGVQGSKTRLQEACGVKKVSQIRLFSHMYVAFHVIVVHSQRSLESECTTRSNISFELQVSFIRLFSHMYVVFHIFVVPAQHSPDLISYFQVLSCMQVSFHKFMCLFAYIYISFKIFVAPARHSQDLMTFLQVLSCMQVSFHIFVCLFSCLISYIYISLHLCVALRGTPSTSYHVYRSLLTTPTK